ncbi:hypothetical protein [Klebsiella oxytoca]|uniref:hypothetical protein n=1 Tax=Klebsiella oxytoca TaxID=571 RepID=UPI003879B6BD
MKFKYTAGLALLIILVLFYNAKSTLDGESLKVNNCSAIINEYDSKSHIQVLFERVVTIAKSKGYARDNGFLKQGGNKWALDRYYNFNVEWVDGDKYEVSFLSYNISPDDNIPRYISNFYFNDSVKNRKNITSIERIDSGIWFFSGIRGALFACKEATH